MKMIMLDVYEKELMVVDEKEKESMMEEEEKVDEELMMNTSLERAVEKTRRVMRTTPTTISS